MIWPVTSPIRGCETYQLVQSSIFVSTKEEPIQLLSCLQFLFSSTNIDCIRHINILFFHIHKSRQWVFLARLSCFFCHHHHRVHSCLEAYFWCVDEIGNNQWFLFLLCFLIKMIYLLNMSFAHHICFFFFLQ